MQRPMTGTQTRRATVLTTALWLLAAFLAGCGRHSQDQSDPPRQSPPALVREEEMDHALLVEPAKETEPDSNREASRQAGRDALFNPGLIPQIRIQINGQAWRQLEREPREFVHADVQVDDVNYRDIGLHLKGRRGSFRSLDSKPGFSLKFNKYKPGQRFYGLEKIHLNNAVQDPSFMTEVLCSQMFREAGVPAARGTHARVELNGRKLGFYVLVEGFTEDFLGRYFENVEGNLYDFPYRHDIRSTAVKESKDRDPSDLRALARAAQEPDLEKRWEQLAQRLDLERFITYLALEVMIWDWDCYAMCQNNYRVYHDPVADKIVFMPHGMDQIFHNPRGSIFPEMKGLVAKAVLGIPEGRRRYFERMAWLTETIFTQERMEGQVSELRNRIRPVLLDLNPNAARKHDQAVARLQQQIRQRIASVQEQLKRPPSQPVPSTHFP